MIWAIVFRLSMLLLDSTKGDIFSKTNRQILFLSFFGEFLFWEPPILLKMFAKNGKN